MSAVAPAVSATYRHADKVASAEPSLALGESVLKWYDVAPYESPVPLAVRALARRCLRDAWRDGALGTLGDLGFVVLHRCGEDFYFLLACTWRNENELWQTVWAKDGDADVLFRPWVTDEAHRPTYCVWELGVVVHEREAWTRYVLSERDEAAQRSYLGDTRSGLV